MKFGVSHTKLQLIPRSYDVFVEFSAPWDDIKQWQICSLLDKEHPIEVRPPGELFSKGDPRKISFDELDGIFICPYSLTRLSEYQEYFRCYLFVVNLASSIIRGADKIEVNSLIEAMIKHKVMKGLGKRVIEGFLRCAVAARLLVTTTRRMKTNEEYFLALSEYLKLEEKRRVFAATIAGELIGLGDRIRSLIDHGSTVGTYRENILQALLRKHIPSRYHVATGFILGCRKQIDILIYDCMEYAPVFREGDLVVVQPDAVRAVIEVKTNLTKELIFQSLKDIDLISKLDDSSPPFFKGIFCFDSRVGIKGVIESIWHYYSLDTFQKKNGGNLIHDPFHHLTCLCVLEKMCLHVDYDWTDEEKRCIPALYSTISLTGLSSQGATFLERLISYLQFKGLKTIKIDGISQMLGADKDVVRERYLASKGWGPYDALDHGDRDDAIDDVREMEETVKSTQTWLNGGGWRRQ